MFRGDAHVRDAQDHDPDPVHVKALAGLVDIDEIGPVHEIVQCAVIPAGIFRTAGFAVQERVGDPGIDDFVDGNALRIVQDGRQGLHVILMRVGDEPQVHMVPGFREMLPELLHLGGIAAVHHEHLSSGSFHQIGFADGVGDRRKLFQGKMPRGFLPEKFLFLLAPARRGAARQGDARGGKSGYFDKISSVHLRLSFQRFVVSTKLINFPVERKGYRTGEPRRLQG